MEQQHEQAGVVVGRSVVHGLSRREVAVGPRTDHLVVDVEPAFEKDDGVGRRVPMAPGLESGRIADEIVLLPRIRILI
jgi:hypothetical protein